MRTTNKMNDEQRKAVWARIDNLHDAVDEFIEHSSYIGTDPYYSDMNDALWAMLIRVRSGASCPNPGTDKADNDLHGT